MHGLIFETSIWLLAGSTRFVKYCRDTGAAHHRHGAQGLNSRRAMVHISQKQQLLCTHNNAAPISRTYNLTLTERAPQSTATVNWNAHLKLTHESPCVINKMKYLSTHWVSMITKRLSGHHQRGDDHCTHAHPKYNPKLESPSLNCTQESNTSRRSPPPYI